MVSRTFQLPDHIAKQLSSLSQKNRRTEKFFVAEALKQYLEEYQDAQIAKQRLDHPRKKLLSSKEFWGRLDV